MQIVHKHSPVTRKVELGIRALDAQRSHIVYLSCMCLMLKPAKVDLAAEFLDPDVSLPSANRDNFRSDQPNHAGWQRQCSLQGLNLLRNSFNPECLMLTLTANTAPGFDEPSQLASGDLYTPSVPELYTVRMTLFRVMASSELLMAKRGNMAETVDWAQ